jgi:Zn-dependent metalloprotease
MMRVLTVKEAVERVNQGENLEGVALDESTIKQVNVRDAMVLSRGGIVVPEQNIYYNDEEIEYDEDIDELVITSGIVKLSWEEKAKRAKEYSAEGRLEREIMVDLSTQKPEIDDWIAKNKQKLETLLKPIVVNLYNAEKIVKE